VGQERELESMNRGIGLDGLVLSTRNDAIVPETDVEAFVRVRMPESSPETETDFIPFNCVDKARMPPSSLHCIRGLYKDLVAHQHAWAVLRQAGDREASESINVWPHSKGKKYGQIEGTPIFESSIRYIEPLQVSPVRFLVRWQHRVSIRDTYEILNSSHQSNTSNICA
jgi:hypothetical protein